jgi:RNA-directed DNA polymerase
MNPLEPLTRLLPASLRLLFTPPHARSEQAQRLAGILHVDVSELASLRMGARFHYRPFTIAKSDGRERRLLAPSPALKRLQRRLLDNYLAQIPVHACATAFRSGCSIIHNARAHARQQLIATVDVRDFFESTRAARVRAFFVKQGWRDHELQTLIRLCVYRNGLPQGAPTSPCLSNLVNLPLDERLWRLAQRTGTIYTRYGDDLTFSWSSDCMPSGFQRAVEDGLHAAGYEIQPRKGWHLTPISDRPCVTGLVLIGAGRVSIPWALRWRMWCLRWQSWWSAGDDVRARLHGYKGYVRMVKSCI